MRVRERVREGDSGKDCWKEERNKVEERYREH